MKALNLLNRILGCIIVVSMLLCVQVSANAEETGTDKVGENEISFLRNIGIIGDWTSSDPVNRGEFVNAAVRCIIKDSGSVDSSDTVRADKDVFSDVSALNWISYNIEVAKNLGIISGVDNNSFSPNSPLTAQAAMKIAVISIGHGFAVDSYDKYLSYASSIGLYKGLHIVNENGLTKGEAAIILKNMLQTAAVEVSISNGIKAYALNSDNGTILSNIHDIWHFTGVIEGTKYSSIDSTDVTSDSYVRVTDVKKGGVQLFNVGKTDAHDRLGLRGEFYYREHENGENELVWMDFSSDKYSIRAEGSEIIEAKKENKEIRLAIRVKENRFDDSVTYRTIRFTTDINIIKNNVFYTDINMVFDILNNATDENIDYIELYDYDGDGKYDILNICTYYTIVADYVLESDEKLTVKDHMTGRVLDIDKNGNAQIIHRYDTNGKVNDYLGITEGNVVSVSKSEGVKDFYSIRISDKTAEDIPLAYSEKEMNTQNSAYEFSDTLKQYYSDKADALLLGEKYLFYLDHNGKIAGYDLMGASTDNYIYVYGTYYDENDGVILKVATLEAKILKFKCADKFTIDGKKTSEATIYDALKQIKNQLVEYEVNKEGEIVALNLPSLIQEEGKLSYSVGLKPGRSVYVKYKSSANAFFTNNVGNVAITSNTTVIQVPHEELNDSGVMLEEFCKKGVSFENDGQYYVKAYHTNSSSVAADILIVCNKGENKILDTTRLAVVARKIMSLNNQEEPAEKITCIQNGSEISLCSSKQYFTDNNGNRVDVDSGDIVQFVTDATGDCVNIRVLYDHDAPYTDVTTPYSTSIRAIRGSVYNCDGTVFYMVKNSWDIGDADVIPANLEAHLCKAKILIYDGYAKKLEIGSVDDIIGYRDNPSDYSRVVVANSFAVPNIIVIYK